MKLKIAVVFLVMFQLNVGILSETITTTPVFLSIIALMLAV